MKGKYVKKAVIYPYNKIAHAIVRFRDMLWYEIVGVVDFDCHIGKDAGDVINIGETGITITDNLEEALQDADSII
ncbi:MAG: hypothetical protein N3E37_05470, partial [Candidatus Micrarchaeota archaeon]|nr:hypothetical protein [Candidatus Micrarchaeota archaeon]